MIESAEPGQIASFCWQRWSTWLLCIFVCGDRTPGNTPREWQWFRVRTRGFGLAPATQLRGVTYVKMLKLSSLELRTEVEGELRLPSLNAAVCNKSF